MDEENKEVQRCLLHTHQAKQIEEEHSNEPSSQLEGGWHVVESGGNGWKVEPEGGPSLFHKSQRTYTTSHDWCKRAKCIDLVEALLHASNNEDDDVFAAQEESVNEKEDDEDAKRKRRKEAVKRYLETGPPITVGQWIRGTGPNFGDTFCLQVELRNEADGVIDSWHSGEIITTDGWTLVTHTFYGYSPSNELRYLHWEDGGKDTEHWAGHFGSRTSGAFLSIEAPLLHCLSRDMPLSSLFLPLEGGKASSLGGRNMRRVKRRRKGIGCYCEEKSSASSLPFYTNFCRGVGKVYCIAGQEARKREWSDMSQQSIQPTYPYDNRVCGHNDYLHCHHDYNNVYEGGSSFAISGIFLAPPSLSSSAVDVPYTLFELFRTNIPLSTTTTKHKKATLCLAYTILSLAHSSQLSIVLRLGHSPNNNDEPFLLSIHFPSCSSRYPPQKSTMHLRDNIIVHRHINETQQPEREEEENEERWQTFYFRIPMDELLPIIEKKLEEEQRKKAALSITAIDLLCFSSSEEQEEGRKHTSYNIRIGELRLWKGDAEEDDKKKQRGPPSVQHLSAQTSWSTASMSSSQPLCDIILSWSLPSSYSSTECYDIFQQVVGDEEEEEDGDARAEWKGRSFSNTFYVQSVRFGGRTKGSNFFVRSVDQLGRKQPLEEASCVFVERPF